MSSQLFGAHYIDEEEKESSKLNDVMQRRKDEIGNNRKNRDYNNALNNYVSKENIQRHFEFSGSLQKQITILDKIKDFFRNFTWPSCCECNEIKNEEINELKAPLNGKSSSIL